MTSSAKSRLLGVAFAAAAIATTATTAPAGPPLPVFQIFPTPIDGPQITPGAREALRDALRSSCVDLAVFANERRLGGNRVQITYGVRNVSSVDYVSGAGQQSIMFSRNSREVQTRNFSRLNAGQTLSWSVTVQTPLEFPDYYKAAFTHGPDLYQDGNELNDDCNARNNAREVVVASA